jgi:transposase
VLGNAKQVRKQKNDRRDAEHLLKLMMKDDFPRIWAVTPDNRDLRQLVWHRHRLVGMRTRVMNQLQAIAMNEGIRRKKGLWTEKGRQQLESLSLMPWTTRRRQEAHAVARIIAMQTILRRDEKSRAK